MAQTDTSISLSRRIFSSSIGSLLTCLFVTPFDVVKTRMQIQSIQIINNKNNSINEIKKIKNIKKTYTTNIKFKNSLDAAIKIWKYEGFKHLYTGLSYIIIMNK